MSSFDWWLFSLASLFLNYTYICLFHVRNLSAEIRFTYMDVSWAASKRCVHHIDCPEIHQHPSNFIHSHKSDKISTRTLKSPNWHEPTEIAILFYLNKLSLFVLCFLFFFIYCIACSVSRSNRPLLHLHMILAHLINYI